MPSQDDEISEPVSTASIEDVSYVAAGAPKVPSKTDAVRTAIPA